MTAARRWVAAAALLLLVAGGALAYGQTSGTFAIFTAETENPNAVFQGSWIPPIASATSSLVTSGSYNQVQLSWTLGTIPSSGNPITGYSVEYAPGGSAGSASCGAYGAFSTPASSPVSVTGTDISQWWCFRIHATSATVWTSATVAFTPQRILVPSSVTLSNKAGQTAGTMEAGDTIKIIYDQAVNVGATVTVNSCTNTIVIGGSCGATGTIGTITGFTTIAHARTFANSTITGSGTTTVTITLVGAQTTTVTGGGTFTASGTGVVLTSNTSEGVCSVSPACSAPSSGDF
jgi:hypothetical protein